MESRNIWPLTDCISWRKIKSCPDRFLLCLRSPHPDQGRWSERRSLGQLGGGGEPRLFCLLPFFLPVPFRFFLPLFGFAFLVFSLFFAVAESLLRTIQEAISQLDGRGTGMIPEVKKTESLPNSGKKKDAKDKTAIFCESFFYFFFLLVSQICMLSGWKSRAGEGRGKKVCFQSEVLRTRASKDSVFFLDKALWRST